MEKPAKFDPLLVEGYLDVLNDDGKFLEEEHTVEELKQIYDELNEMGVGIEKEFDPTEEVEEGSFLGWLKDRFKHPLGGYDTNEDEDEEGDHLDHKHIDDEDFGDEDIGDFEDIGDESASGDLLPYYTLSGSDVKKMNITQAKQLYNDLIRNNIQIKISAPQTKKDISELATWFDKHSKELNDGLELLPNKTVAEQITYAKASRYSLRNMQALYKLLSEDYKFQDDQEPKASPISQSNFLDAIYEIESTRLKRDSTCNLHDYENLKGCEDKQAYCNVETNRCMPPSKERFSSEIDGFKATAFKDATLKAWKTKLEEQQKSLALRKEGKKIVIIPPCGPIEGREDEYKGCDDGKVCNLNTEQCEEADPTVVHTTVNGFKVMGSADANQKILANVRKTATSKGTKPTIIEKKPASPKREAPSKMSGFSEVSYMGYTPSSIVKKYTVADLKGIADKIGFKGYGRVNKDEFIEKIKAFIVAKAAEKQELDDIVDEWENPEDFPPEPSEKKTYSPKRAPSPKRAASPPKKEDPSYKTYKLSDITSKLTVAKLKEIAKNIGLSGSTSRWLKDDWIQGIQKEIQTKGTVKKDSPPKTESKKASPPKRAASPKAESKKYSPPPKKASPPKAESKKYSPPPKKASPPKAESKKYSPPPKKASPPLDEDEKEFDKPAKPTAENVKEVSMAEKAKVEEIQRKIQHCVGLN